MSPSVEPTSTYGLRQRRFSLAAVCAGGRRPAAAITAFSHAARPSSSESASARSPLILAVHRRRCSAYSTFVVLWFLPSIRRENVEIRKQRAILLLLPPAVFRFSVSCAEGKCQWRCSICARPRVCFKLPSNCSSCQRILLVAPLPSSSSCSASSAVCSSSSSTAAPEALPPAAGASPGAVAAQAQPFRAPAPLARRATRRRARPPPSAQLPRELPDDERCYYHCHCPYHYSFLYTADVLSKLPRRANVSGRPPDCTKLAATETAQPEPLPTTVAVCYMTELLELLPPPPPQLKCASVTANVRSAVAAA